MSENNKLFISMYYYVRDLKHSRYPGIKEMAVSQFRNQMEFFRGEFPFGYYGTGHRYYKRK